MAESPEELTEKAEVYTFADIVDFSQFRARKSAERNDPWAWAYWSNTEEWASRALDDPLLSNPESWPEAVKLFLDEVDSALRSSQYIDAAQAYAHAKWLRILSLNNRFDVVKPLSLKWLHQFEGIR